MNKVNKMIVKASLKTMFKNGYINICTIKNSLDLVGYVPTGERLAQLEALHCVRFADMDPELATMMPQLVADLFTDQLITTADIFDDQFQERDLYDITPHRRNPILRLLGR